MSFSAPAFLPVLAGYLLLLVFLGLRARMRPVPLSSFAYLARALTGLASPRRRGIDLRTLLLGLPAALALLGAAGPRIDRGPGAPRVVILLDRSPSMDADDGGWPRHAAWLSAARSSCGEDCEVLGIAPSARSVAGGSFASVEEQLVREAARLRAAGAAVLVVTDRVPRGLPKGVGVHAAGAPAEGAGITAVRDCGQDGIFVATVRAPSTTARTLVATAEFVDGRKAPLEVRPDGEDAFFVATPGGAEAVGIELSLEPGDAFALDDRVSLRRLPKTFSVALPLAGEVAVGRALAAIPGVVVSRGARAADLAVGSKALAPRRLFVAPDFPGGTGVRGSGPASGTLVAAGLALPVPADALAFDRLFALEPVAGDSVLASVDGRPLLVSRGKDLFLLVGPDATDWPARPSFPLLLAAAVGPLLPEAAPTGFGAWPLFSRVELPWPATRILLPDGSLQPVDQDGGTTAVVFETPGIHRVEGEDDTVLLPAFLLDEGESRDVLEPARATVGMAPAEPGPGGTLDLRAALVGAAAVLGLLAAWSCLGRGAPTRGYPSGGHG